MRGPGDVAWARRPAARMTRQVLLGAVVLPLLGFFNPVSVRGRANLRDLGPAVFVANHASHLDVFACLAAVGARRRRRLLVAAAADYFYGSRVGGAALSLAVGSVPFVRDGGSRGSLEMLKGLLGDGWSVLIFPAGTRGGTEVKAGFSYLAVDAGVPVVPIHLDGPQHAMPKGTVAPLPGGMAAVIGTPLAPGDDYADLVERTREAFGRLSEERS